MKLNEFKQPKKVDEALSDYIGNIGAAGVKKMFSNDPENKMSTTDIAAKEIFLKDFLGKASSNLNSAIRSGLVDPSVSATPSPTAGTAPETPKTPEEIRKEKQAMAAQTAQKQMGANPVPAKAAPKTPAQIRQEKQKTATASAQQQMAPASKLSKDQFAKAAANVRKQKQQQAVNALEGKFNKLNAIFENIIGVDEATTQARSIANHLKNWFKKYTTISRFNTDVERQLDTLANQAQATYSKDKGVAALRKMGDLAYSVMQSGETADATIPSDVTQYEPAQGFAGAVSAAQQADASMPQQEKTVYMQVKDLLGKLDKKGKQRILATLSKELMASGTKPTSPTKTTSPSNAMGNMASQLANRPTTSSTGGTTTGISGMGNGTVTHTAGRGTKAKQAQATRAKAIPAKKVTRKKAVAA